MSAEKTRHEIGMAVRRAVLGEAYVAKAEGSKSDFDADFQAFIAEGAWGTVWARPQIPRRERSMVTVAILAALGREEELALHLKATAQTGASREDIRETLMHVGVYAGVPAANSAFRIAKRVFAEIDASAAGPEH